MTQYKAGDRVWLKAVGESPRQQGTIRDAFFPLMPAKGQSELTYVVETGPDNGPDDCGLENVDQEFIEGLVSDVEA